MSPDDDDPDVEIMPPDRPSQAFARDSSGRGLPEIPLPPSGIVRNAFLTAVRFKSTKRAIAAYKEAVREAVEAQHALASLNEAMLERERAVRLLEDAETVHAADAAARRKDLVRAERELKDAEADAEIATMERARRLERAKREHAGAQKRGGGYSDAELSDDEREFRDDFLSGAQSLRYRRIAEAIIEDLIAEFGGEENLTEAEKKHVNGLRERLDQIISDREPL